MIQLLKIGPKGINAMKRLLSLLMIISVLCVFCACKDKKNNIYFENETGSEISAIYLSPKDSEDWGSELNEKSVKSGSSLTIPKEKLSQGENIYDLGSIDMDSYNYDIYNIPVKFGDTLTLSRKDGKAFLVVVSADGSTKQYEGEEIYQDSEDSSESTPESSK